jgi:hypothetical protein
MYMCIYKAWQEYGAWIAEGVAFCADHHARGFGEDGAYTTALYMHLHEVMLFAQTDGVDAVQVVLLLQQLGFFFLVVGIGKATIHRTYRRALRLIVKALALRALVWNDVVERW